MVDVTELMIGQAKRASDVALDRLHEAGELARNRDRPRPWRCAPKKWPRRPRPRPPPTPVPEPPPPSPKSSRRARRKKKAPRTRAKEKGKKK